MPELLTVEIARRYRYEAARLLENGNQDIGKRRELRLEVQILYGLTELEAVNIINGYNIKDYVARCERRYETMINEEIKTMKGWETAADQSEDPARFSWSDYAKPGDLVREDVYENFLNVLPPMSMGCGYLQVGEPYSHRENPKTGRWQATYMTFTYVREGVWRYCGNCFVGETDNVE